MKLIKKIICLFKKHELKDEPEFGCYIRDGRRFKYNGRIFRCKRCNATIHIHGVMDRELEDLIKTTLKDLPAMIFKLDYGICGIYQSSKNGKNLMAKIMNFFRFFKRG